MLPVSNRVRQAGILACVLAVSLYLCRHAATVFADESGIMGNWSGDSICQVAGSPCQNEKVVYHIATAKEAGKVTVTADRIVNGRPVNMGSIDFDYDERNGTLINQSSRGVWKLVVEGKRMNGTLTLPDETVYRKVTLKKDEQ